MKFLTGAMRAVLLCASIGASHAQGSASDQPLPDYKGQKLEIPGASAPVSSAVTVTSASGLTALTTVPMYPVLYCGGAGGVVDEYRVIPGAAPVRWLLEVPSPPAGAKIYDARYEAYDNLAAINAFAEILVEKVDDDHVSITAQAYPNCATARVRLRVTVSYAK